MRNLITDVAGVLVGNAQDARAATGATVVVFEKSTVASVATLGGAPGDRAVTLLEPEMTRGLIDAVVLSGGSLYGLDAAGGATSVLCAQGKGAQFGGLTLPVAVQAILFDLMNGGEKDWLKEPMKRRPPYWELGRDAALAAAKDFGLGSVGAGLGGTTAKGRTVQRIGVLGSGLMGAGIATAHARRGIPSMMVDVSNERLADGLGRARKVVEGRIEIGRATPKDVADIDRKSTRLNSSHMSESRMPSSA